MRGFVQRELEPKVRENKARTIEDGLVSKNDTGERNNAATDPRKSTRPALTHATLSSLVSFHRFKDSDVIPERKGADK